MNKRLIALKTFSVALSGLMAVTIIPKTTNGVANLVLENPIGIETSKEQTIIKNDPKQLKKTNKHPNI